MPDQLVDFGVRCAHLDLPCVHFIVQLSNASLKHNHLFIIGDDNVTLFAEASKSRKSSLQLINFGVKFAVALFQTLACLLG